AWFICWVSICISSLALSVADFIARRRAASSEAADCSSAAKMRDSTYLGSSDSSTSPALGSNSKYGGITVDSVASVSSTSSGRTRLTTTFCVSLEPKWVETMWTSSVPLSSLKESISVVAISLASAYDGFLEKPVHSPPISRWRKVCQVTPLTPLTNGTYSIPRPSMSPRSASASRSTLALKPPQNPL